MMGVDRAGRDLPGARDAPEFLSVETVGQLDRRRSTARRSVLRRSNGIRVEDYYDTSQSVADILALAASGRTTSGSPE